MELTKEDFEKSMAILLAKVITKDDLGIALEKVATKVDIQDMVTKVDIQDMATTNYLQQALNNQTADLKAYIHQGMEIQQEWMDERFNELIPTYDVRERVVRLEKDVHKV